MNVSSVQKKRLLFALLGTIFFFAVTHLSILALHALLTNTPEELNVFAILQLELFLPGILDLPYSFVLSYLFLTGVFSCLYWYTGRKPKSHL